MTPLAADEPVLRINGLKTHFFTREGVVKAVDGVDLAVRRGEILGIVGESGCGKSVTALSVLRLIPSPPGRIISGRIEFKGRDLLELDARSMRRIRGDQISMIFQDPLSSLNPVQTVGFQIAEILRFHRSIPRLGRTATVLQLLRAVDIPAPEDRIRQYPHQLSGGLRQRVMIAMALACEPAVLIADEPTTALDVTVQAQVLKLIKQLCREHMTAVILITHDMGVIANMCRRVAVMYAGHVLEESDVEALFAAPAHPYTRGLLDSLPSLGRKQQRLGCIPGQPPRLTTLPPGCPFAARCNRAAEVCRREMPPIAAHAPDHRVRCFFPLEGAA
jgi:oligopeptide transport system ATP-binding protein